LKRKWILVTFIFVLFIGGLGSTPVFASKDNLPLTFLEKLSLNRSYENYQLTKVINTTVAVFTQSEFLLPSDLVESHQPEIKKLAYELTTGKKTDEEKSKALFLWVVNNISYDAEEYFADPENPRYYSSLETLQNKKALCSGYANLNAALHRSIGLEAKVVYGEGHAWNEVKLDGKWQEQDPTYGSGVIDLKKEIFVPTVKKNYFDNADLRKEGEFPW
jgi:transglutaminase/protease-like cytokinesis protein 3